jgi:uncharacterized protein YbdZ (MbtH family)
MAEQDEDTREYIVLINAEEQYSLWLKQKKIPEGWRATGMEGSKSRVLELRRQGMEGHAPPQPAQGNGVRRPPCRVAVP